MLRMKRLVRGFPDAWKSARMQLVFRPFDGDVADIEFPRPESAEDVHNPRLEYGSYTCGHHIFRDSPTGRVTWISWTVEDNRVQKNSVFVFGANLDLIEASVNCFALGWRMVDASHVDRAAKELLNSTGWEVESFPDHAVVLQ